MRRFLAGSCHIVWGIANCITIIGIPFGIQHFKLRPGPVSGRESHRH
jgi:uncharacterized membrane protein YccF (DUF307 family)